MAKTKTKKKKKNKQKTNMLWVLFIAIMFVISSFGVITTSNNPNQNQFKYKDHEFTYTSNSMITTTIDNQILEFYIEPFYVEDYLIDPDFINNINNADFIYISTQANFELPEMMNAAGLASFDLINDLLKLGKLSVNAMSEENPYDLPVISCENSSEKNPVILLKSDNETKITREGYCLILSSNSPQGFLILRDAVAYRLFNITN